MRHGLTLKLKDAQFSTYGDAMAMRAMAVSHFNIHHAHLPDV
jgi:hypothetical protein